MKLSFSSIAARSPAYRADIDGLRAVAVLSVLGYHVGATLFHGGFVGVDVFFVISGYLIAGIIQGEIDSGHFSFRTFYARRIRRILPALIALTLACTGVAAILFAPQQLVEYGRSLAALAAFGSNIYFQSTTWGAGYFEFSSGSKLLLQTWSLSVEEQFYILFPLTLLLLNRLGRRTLRLCILLIAALSLALSISQTGHHLTASFYLLPSRAWELLLGVLLALKPLPPLRNRAAREIAALAGLVAIGFAINRFSSLTPFPGINALYPCLGAALILYAGESGSSITKRILSFPPLVFVGVISYSLYLWHWPAVAITSLLHGTSYMTRNCALGVSGLSLLIAFLSFEFIESPFRRPRASNVHPLRVVAFGVGISAAVGLGAFVLIALHGLPGRYKSRTRELVIANYALKQDFPRIPSACNNWHTPMNSYADASFCAVDPSSQNILVWGDSHAAQLFPVLVELDHAGKLHGQGIVFASSAGCPPAEKVNLAAFGYHCDRFTSFAMMRAAQSDIHIVFFQFLPTWELADGTVCASRNFHCERSLSREEALTAILADFSARIRALRAMGKRVIVGVPFPFYTQNIPDYEIRQATMGDPLKAGRPFDLIPNRLRDQFRATALSAGAEIYDPRSFLCPEGRCLYAIDGISLYMDQSHFAGTRVSFLRQSLLDSLEPHPTASPH